MRNSRLKKHARRDRARRSFRPSIERLEDRRVLAVSIAPIQAWAYVDLNNDGLPQVGEPGIEGVTITLTDSMGTNFPRVTDATGRAWFGGNWPVAQATLVASQPPEYTDGLDFHRWNGGVTGPGTVSPFGEFATQNDRMDFVNANYRDASDGQGFPQPSFGNPGFASLVESWYFAERPKVDLSASTLEILPNGSAHGSYEIVNSNLTNTTKVSLYWATGETFAQTIGAAIQSQDIPKGTASGTYTFDVASQSLANPPSGATHLVLAIDPNSPFDPNRPFAQVPETNELNNDAAVALPGDIVATILQGDPASGDVVVGYRVDSAPIDSSVNPTFELYWGTGPSSSDRIGAALYSDSLSKAVGIYSPLSVQFNAQNRPTNATHLLLIVDPGEVANELSETNNHSSLELCTCPPLSTIAQLESLYPPLTPGMAQQFEDSNGNLVDEANLNASFATQINLLRQLVAAEPGTQSFTVRSAYRPTAYQAHFYEIQDRFIRLDQEEGIDPILVTSRPQLAIDASSPNQACQALVDAINAEINKHQLQRGAAGAPIAAPPGRSLHEVGLAADINIQGISEKKIDELAAQVGMFRPFPGKDPTHFQPIGTARSLPPVIQAHSPIDLLLTDPLGRRLGIDPSSGQLVNDFGPDASYMGSGDEPKTLLLPPSSIVAGAYSITGIGTGDGPYTIVMTGFAAGDTALLDEVLASGIAAKGVPIAPISGLSLVNLINDSPVADDDAAITPAGAPVLVDVVTNDFDSDGVLDPTTVAIVLPPANGAVTVDPVTGVVTYTPNAGYIGADSFTYQVSDDLGAASNEATVTIAVQATNVAPVASNDSVTVYKNVPLLINVLSNDSDSDGSLDPATVAIVGAPQHGTLSINAATGEIEYAPVTDYTGNDQFTYTVQDDTGAISNSATVFVAVNAPPVANDDSASAITNSPKLINVLANDEDADGALNPTSVTIVSPPSSGAVAVDPITGAVTYQSAAGFTGSDSFQYQVLDNVAAFSNTATVTVTVAANQAPVAQNDHAITLIDSAVLIKLLTNDADADGNLAVASVTITQQPTSGAVTVDANGVATYTPNLGFQGTDQFTYTVSDQAGAASNPAQARVRVIPAAEFTTLSPTIGGVLPSGVTAIGGMVLDLVGLNGVRVVSQLAASQLYVGYFDSGTPTSFQGNPGTIGVQSGFSAAILQALGGGLSEVAVRVTLFDGDTGPSDFDDGGQNYLLLNGVNLGDFSDVMTQQRSSDGVQVLSNNAVGGFRNEILDTGFFYSNQRQVLDAFFATLSHGSVSYQLQDDDPFDNFFDFTQGIDGGLINVGQGPNVAPSATDDAATTNANTPVTIDVLQNDSDADGTLDASEVVVVDLPSHGTTSVDPVTGRITYTPIQGYAGADSFTYRVKDNTGSDSNAATVSVTVAAGSSLLPFRDDFNRSDNGDLGPAWTERYGDLKIRANELSPTDKDTAIATVDDVLLSDVIVSADVDITRNDKVVGKVGILARYSGPGDKNYYMARLTQNGDNFAAQIYRNVNGAFTRLSTANVPGGAGTLKFVVVGSTLKLYFNGAIVGDVQDTALSDPGMVGVRHAGGYLDNMFVDAATNIAPPVPPDVPEFSDSFNRASDTNLGAGWTEHAGDVAISNNRVRPTGGNPSLATAQNFAAADVSLSAFVEAHSTGDVGIVARYSGPGDQNYYLARVTQTGGKYLAQIYRNLGGVWAQLSSALLSSNQGTLRFDLSGPSLRLYFNGQIMGNVVDSALSGAGLVGLRMTSGSMDSFSATKLVITAPTPTQVLFSDDFNRGDSTQLGSSWTEKTGNAKTDNTHLAVVNGAQSIVTVNGMEPTDVSLAADVNMSSESKIGLIARYAGPGEANFYMGRLTINGSQVTAQIYSNVNGTFTRLTSTPVPGGTGSLRFDVVGTSLKLYFNGQLVGDAQDTSISGPGLVGVRSSGGTVDNFVVRSPSSSIPTSSPAFGDSFERPNGSALGPSWLERIGDLKIDGNRLAVASASLSLATVQGLSHVDISLSADVNLSATSKIGLVARYAGPADANYYLARLSVIAGQVTAEIYRNLAGTLTLLSSSPVSGGTGTLRFDVLGSVLKLYYKGQLISEVQDNSLSSPGLVGVQMDGGIVDSFNAVRL